MASSGVLVARAADALGLPAGAVATVLKALRNHRMITMKGRGVAAATMTPEDAATLLAGIATGAGTAEIPPISRMLLSMPAQHQVGGGASLVGLERLEPNPLNYLKPRHLFLVGLSALLQEEIIPARNEYGELTGRTPLGDGAYLMIGLDGKKTVGFAAFQGFVRQARVKIYYSTLPRRTGVGPDEEPGGLGLELFQDAPGFITQIILGARPLRALARAVAPDP